jgi:hypothetical protein
MRRGRSRRQLQSFGAEAEFGQEPSFGNRLLHGRSSPPSRRKLELMQLGESVT